MKRDSDEVVNSIYGTGYVDIVTEGHKYAGSNASDWSMVAVSK